MSKIGRLEVELASSKSSDCRYFSMGEKALKLLMESENVRHQALSPLMDNAASSLAAVEKISGISRADLKRIGLLRVVLTYVVDNKYDESIRVIKDHIENKREYPFFKERTERFVQYAEEIVQQIKQKREVLAIPSLSNSKQHELREKVQVYFKELRKTLAAIEQIEREIHIEDIKTTVWIVKSGFYAMASVFAVMLYFELTGGVIQSFGSLYLDLVERFMSLVFN